MTSSGKAMTVSGIAALFIFLFVYTALSKLFHFSQFAHTLSRTTLLHPFASWVAWVLPLTELVIALMLFIHGTRTKGLWASFVLMLAFTAYIAYMLGFERHIPCSCGGILASLTWTHHLQLNVVLLLLSMTGLLLAGKAKPKNTIA